MRLMPSFESNHAVLWFCKSLTEILLLDEPTTFLDMCHQLEVLETLAKINREYGTTIVMVLHDLQQAAAYCHHMIAMKDGGLADSGEPRTMITPRFMRSVFDLDARISFAERYPIIIPILKTDEEEETMIIVTNVSQIAC
jgi:iron complex transport system ATP-binding protein